MKTITAEEMKKLEKHAIEILGIPSLTLMENAGKSVADDVIEQTDLINDPKVVVVCGTGNNGGDGFVCARYLLEEGIETCVYIIGDLQKLKGGALINYQRLQTMPCVIHTIQEVTAEFIDHLKNTDCVVDAIFGLGLNRMVESPFKDIIETVNQNTKRIIAVDIPSGLDATTGKVYGTSIKADRTITFCFSKIGFAKEQGPSLVGHVVVEGIGIPVESLGDRIKGLED